MDATHVFTMRYRIDPIAIYNSTEVLFCYHYNLLSHLEIHCVHHVCRYYHQHRRKTSKHITHTTH